MVYQVTPYMLSRYLYKIVCKEEIAIVPINVIKTRKIK